MVIRLESLKPIANYMLFVSKAGIATTGAMWASTAQSGMRAARTACEPLNQNMQETFFLGWRAFLDGTITSRS